MRQLSRLAAMLFVCWYGAFYLASGPGEIMQRDWLAVIPIALAFAIMANTRVIQFGTSFLAGLLLGMCACVKPQLAMAGAPILIGLHLLGQRAETRTPTQAFKEFALRVALPAMLGFAAPVIAVLAWLAHGGALSAFTSMVRDYLPLHIQQTGDHAFLPPSERLRYIAMNAVQLNGYWPMMIAAVIGLGLVDRQFSE